MTSSYRDTLLGELRLFECYGVERELPKALDWTPRRAVLDRIVASELQKVQRASASWSLGMSWRRMKQTMVKGFMLSTTEYEWFTNEEVA